MKKFIPPPARVSGACKAQRQLEFPIAERKLSNVLIVECDEETRNSMRSSLRNLGFGDVVSVFDHYAAIKKFDDHKFSHVLFDARNSEMPSKEFVVKALWVNPELVAVPTSYDPTVDNVFDLMKAGSAGYLVKPFTESSLEEAIVLATKGEPIVEEILHSVNRNQALASIALTCLDSLATILRQARQFDTAKVEVSRNQRQFERAIQMGRLFAQDGDAGLVLAYIERAIQCSEQASSRLGRTRLRRQNSNS